MQKSTLITIVFLVVLFFFILMLFSKSDKNKVFILYILFTFPFLSIDLIPAFGSFTIFEFLTIVFFLIFYRSKNTSVKNGYLYLVFFSLLTLATLIGVINAHSITNDTSVALIQFICLFAFAKILIHECIENAVFYASVIKTLKFSLFFSLVFLLCQFYFGIDFSIERSLNSNVLVLDVIRYPSYFQDPQKYAQFLAATSFLLLIKDKDHAKLPLINYLLLFLSFLALLFTGGRAGLGGWCVGVVFFILFADNKFKLLFLITILIFFLVVYNFSENFAMFKRSSLSDAYDFRKSIWEDAISIFTRNPFFGIGIGNYANYVSIHNPDQFWITDNRITVFSHPESGYLKFLTEFGIFGFLSVVTLLLFPIFSAFGEFLKTRDASLILIISALLSWLVGFYTVYSFDDSRIRVLVTTLFCLLITNYQREFSKDNILLS